MINQRPKFNNLEGMKQWHVIKWIDYLKFLKLILNVNRSKPKLTYLKHENNYTWLTKLIKQNYNQQQNWI